VAPFSVLIFYTVTNTLLEVVDISTLLTRNTVPVQTFNITITPIFTEYYESSSVYDGTTQIQSCFVQNGNV